MHLSGLINVVKSQIPLCGNLTTWEERRPQDTIRMEMLLRGAPRWEDLSPRAQVDVMRKVCQPNQFTLLPTSKYIERWDAFMVCVLVYTFFVTPYEVAFLEPCISVLFVCNRIADMSFLTEMIISCFTAYQHEQTASGSKGFWVTNLRKIRWQYCKKWFFIDLLSLLSSFFEVLSIILKSSDLRRLQVMRVLRMSRLIRLLGILKTSRMINRMISRVEVSFSMVEVIRWAMRLLMVAHLMSCIWGMVAFVNEGYGVQSWLTSLETSKGHEFNREEPFTIYCVCLYWAMMTVTSIGYGDIQAQNLQEYVVCTFLMLVGGIMWTQIIGSACAAVSTMDKERIEHEQRMDSVLRMCQDRNLNPELRQRLRTYFIRGRRMARIATYGQVTKFMSPALRGEVALRVTERYLQRIRFLVGVEDAFVVALAKELELHLFPPNEWLVPEALAPFVSVINEVVNNCLVAGSSTGGTFCSYDESSLSLGTTTTQGDHLDLDLASVLSKGVLDKKHVPPLTIMERGVATRSRMLCAGSCWHEDIILSKSRLRDPTLAQSLSFCSVYTLSQRCFNEVLHGGLFPEARKVVRWAAVRLALSRLVRASSDLLMQHRKKSLISAVDRIMGLDHQARHRSMEMELPPVVSRKSEPNFEDGPAFASRRSDASEVGWKRCFSPDRSDDTPVRRTDVYDPLRPHTVEMDCPLSPLSAVTPRVGGRESRDFQGHSRDLVDRLSSVDLRLSAMEEQLRKTSWTQEEMRREREEHRQMLRQMMAIVSALYAAPRDPPGDRAGLPPSVAQPPESSKVAHMLPPWFNLHKELHHQVPL